MNGKKDLANLKEALFDFLCKKYIQRCDMRQKEMGLLYTTAETHDLAKELERFLLRYIFIEDIENHG